MLDQLEPPHSHRPDVVLSVIIPCYNVELYLEDNIRSLHHNVADGYEFIFVDDASTDSTPQLLERLTPALSGSRVLTSPVNVGLAAARNLGIDAARGRYLTFLDSDDLVGAGYYPQLVSQIRELAVDFVRTDHVRFTGNRRVIDRVPFGPRRRAVDPRTGVLPITRSTAVDYPFAWAGVFDRRLVERGLLHFTAGLRTCEDRPWIWRLHLHADSFAVVGLLGLFYRRSIAGSLSQVSDDRQFDFIPAFDQIVADAASDRQSEAVLAKALRSYCAIMCHQLSRLDRYQPQLAEQLLRRSREAVARLPQPALASTLTSLDPGRRQRINDLIEAA